MIAFLFYLFAIVIVAGFALLMLVLFLHNLFDLFK